MRKIKFTLIFILFALTSVTYAQKPAWINNPPTEKNDTYRFVEILSYGKTLEEARLEAQRSLETNEQLKSSVTICTERTENRHTEQKFESGELSEVVNKVIDVKTSVKGKDYTLQAGVVDEYTTTKNGLCQLHTLYMVAVEPNPVFDHVQLTNKYGAQGLWRSAICPGWGQMYKGSKAKGISILAAEVAAIGGIIFTENERATYESKMRSQPKLALQYKTKMDNYATARNCCIGAAVAIYVYNLIDAIVASGSKRVVVKPRNLQVNPITSKDYSGIALRYSF